MTEPGERTPLLARYALAPAEIERQSLAQIERTLADSLPADPAERAVTRRIVYAGGDLGLAPLVRLAPGAVATAVAALRTGCRLVADVRMVLVALNRRHAECLGCEMLTAIDDQVVAERARRSGLPRAAEAMRHLHEAGRLDGAGVVVGNAPTALLALLDLVDAGHCLPAFVIGMPVGFVAARESKEELVTRALPWLTIEGTRGGSPLAAAAANALLTLAVRDVMEPAGAEAGRAGGAP